MEKIFIIDPGHGGMIDGQYQTAPRKMYQHENGDLAYEGVINRKVADLSLKLMKEQGLRCINLCPTELDIELDERVDIANTYVREYGKDNVVGISLHSNAGGGEGFEIWTSPGQTKSDIYAKIFFDQFSKVFNDWKMRPDHCDGDPDKESLFYILVHTKCPWILPEWGFFDNYKDWALIRESSQQLKYAKMIVEFAKWVLFKDI